MARAQSELTGRLDGMAAAQETARGELTRTLTEQLTTVSKTVADNLKDTGERTTRTLGDLGQRLSLIDKAQQEITALSGQVVELQQILDNKQARGAFGEAQLADIVRDGLPETAYAFQHTLSNGRRADCLIRLPNPPGPVVVDSKFPLEAYQRWRGAESDEAARAALPPCVPTPEARHRHCRTLYYSGRNGGCGTDVFSLGKCVFRIAQPLARSGGKMPRHARLSGFAQHDGTDAQHRARDYARR
ncbi:MAG: hypothetical protein CM15mP55_1100 [Hyphomicrobiales bacterium]|nr:MAG: hypothetical protein CM15mP55_1100 [Hyphomicrobiales bacterium]